MKLKKLFENDRKDETKSRIERVPSDPDRRDKTKSRLKRLPGELEDDSNDDDDEYLDELAAQVKRASEKQRAGDPSRITKFDFIVGSKAYMPPEKITQHGGEHGFGKPPIDTPLPPFPYHPENAAVIDPEHQVYYVLKSEGPLHWRDVFSKIVPYLKEFSETGREPPQFDAYGEAVVNLLKRGVIHKTTDGKFYTF